MHMRLRLSGLSLPFATPKRRSPARNLQMEFLEGRVVLSGWGAAKSIADGLKIGNDHAAGSGAVALVKTNGGGQVAVDYSTSEILGSASGHGHGHNSADPGLDASVPQSRPGQAKQSNSGDASKDSGSSPSDNGTPSGQAKQSNSDSGSPASDNGHELGQGAGHAQQDLGNSDSAPGHTGNNNAGGNNNSNGESGSGSAGQAHGNSENNGLSGSGGAGQGHESSQSDNGQNQNGASDSHGQGYGSGKSDLSNDQGPAASGRVDHGVDGGGAEDPASPPVLTAASADDGGTASTWISDPESNLEGTALRPDQPGQPSLVRMFKQAIAPLTQPTENDAANLRAADSSTEVARTESAPAHESGCGDELAPDYVAEALAGPLQTVPASADGFIFAESWHDFLLRVRATGEEVMQHVPRSGPAYWLTGAALTLVAVELVRSQRERRLKQAGTTTWPEIVAPSGLA
jgi:hypothetical protein